MHQVKNFEVLCYSILHVLLSNFQKISANLQTNLFRTVRKIGTKIKL